MFKFKKMIANYIPKESYGDMVTRIQSYEGKGVTVVDRGASSDSTKNIYALDYTQPDKPTFMMTASVHGNEWESAYWTLQFFDYIVNPESAPEDAQPYFNRLKDTYGFYILPVVNPWGFDRGSRLGMNSVDHNREFLNDSYAENRAVKESISTIKPLLNIDNHTSSLAYETVGIGGYGNDIRVLGDNIIKNSNFILSMGRVAWYPVPAVQTDKNIGRGYISDQESIRNTKVLSLLLEGRNTADYTETSIQEKLDFGLNSILIACLYADRYLKRKIQK